jgi:hypothetical protein
MGNMTKHPRVCRLKQWINALESDKYKQCQGTLHNVAGEFCVWGVAIDLHTHQGGKKWGKNKYGEPTYNSDTDHPPTALVRQLGLSIEERDELIELNDGGHSFKEIAKVLKNKYLPRLEKRVRVSKKSLTS